MSNRQKLINKILGILGDAPDLSDDEKKALEEIGKMDHDPDIEGQSTNHEVADGAESKSLSNWLGFMQSNRFLSFIKWFLGTCLLVWVSLWINDSYKQKSESFVYLEKHYERYFDKFLVGNPNPEVKLIVARYFSSILQDRSLRKRWEAYGKALLEEKKDFDSIKLSKEKEYKIYLDKLDSIGEVHNGYDSLEIVGKLSGYERLKYQNLMKELGRLDHISNQKEVVAMANKSLPTPPTENEWIVVVAGDISLEQAKYELGIARKLDSNKAKILLREGMYRTVLGSYSSESMAYNMRNLARKHEKNRWKDAYVVKSQAWCGAIIPTQDKDCLLCELWRGY